MLNQKSVDAVDQSTFGARFVKPLYGSYCFSRIPGTIEQILTGKSDRSLPPDTLPEHTGEKVLTIFVDSFGWVFWKKYCDQYPFLKRFISDGVVSKLTSQFPSTTAAHVTTINTGKEIAEHGIFEWFVYDPETDYIIQPVMYAEAGSNKRDSLTLDPKKIFPQETLYTRLRDKQIPSFVFQHRDYTPSVFTDAIFSGAQVIPYASLAHAMTEIVQKVHNTPGSAYFYFYTDLIDGAAHRTGPDSPGHVAEIHNVLTMLEDVLVKGLVGDRVTIIFTADHGMTPVDPKTTVYINKDDVLSREVLPFLNKNKKGQYLEPAGFPRDMCLYVNTEHTDHVIQILKERLAGKAEVFTTKELLQQGFYGETQPSEMLLQRLGQIIIAPYRNESVWWFEQGKFSQSYYGYHGGLTREEMEIPFAVVNL